MWVGLEEVGDPDLRISTTAWGEIEAAEAAFTETDTGAPAAAIPFILVLSKSSLIMLPSGF